LRPAGATSHPASAKRAGPKCFDKFEARDTLATAPDGRTKPSSNAFERYESSGVPPFLSLVLVLSILTLREVSDVHVVNVPGIAKGLARTSFGSKVFRVCV